MQLTPLQAFNDASETQTVLLILEDALTLAGAKTLTGKVKIASMKLERVITHLHSHLPDFDSEEN